MLGIVIVNWNGEKLLNRCIDSILESSYTKYKLILVDNGSKDNSKKIISGYLSDKRIELIELSTNTGFAKANNIGIDRSLEQGCDTILTLNNDTEIKKDTLKLAMENVNKNIEYDFFQLLMINFYDRNICDAAGMSWDKYLLPTQLGYKENLDNIENYPEEIKGVCAGASIYRAKALIETKLKNGDYFDSSFFAYYEDVDLSIRLSNSGFKGRLIKEAIVYHVHSATGNVSSGFKEYYLYRNMLLYTKRNLNKNLYKKYKYKYYKIIVANIIKNIRNKEIRNSLIRAFRDGLKLSKSICLN